MKKLLTLVAAMLIAVPLYAQHRLQMDDGAGHYTLVTGQTLNLLDNVIFPPGGGTLITTGGGGPSLGWLTAGNTLSGGEKFGSLNGFDVIMYANNIEKLRLVSGGGTSITGGLTLNGLTTGSLTLILAVPYLLRLLSMPMLQQQRGLHTANSPVRQLHFRQAALQVAILRIPIRIQRLPLVQ